MKCLYHVRCIDVRAFLIIYTGWGRTVGGGSAAVILQQAMLPVAAHRDCSRVNGRLARVDERSMVCAGRQGKGGCQVKCNYDESNFYIHCNPLFLKKSPTMLFITYDNNCHDKNKRSIQTGCCCYELRRMLMKKNM